MSNHLTDETSPYLLQHARNPVDWYPWCDEALERARSEDKPIFLSIGYAACHWCHVMEHESFENADIAAFLNEHFISIKVDREERPDLDEIYMMAVQLMTGSGGWPMSVFMTPDLKPFFTGTYFPPDDRFGRPGFMRVLQQLHHVWKTKRSEVDESAAQITEAVQAHTTISASTQGGVDRAWLAKATEELTRTFDSTWGGFGGAPKFPPSASIQWLLTEYKHMGDPSLLHMATCTLDRMAFGGMYDQLGGGFHRYAVDERWLVPHFEKMLYDNALLASVYLDAYLVTTKPLYRDIASQTLDYVLRDMRAAGGAFCSSEDADSEGEEGIFYTWTSEEVRATLGREDADLVCAFFGVTDEGHVEGRNVLHRPMDDASFAEKHGIDTSTLARRMDVARNHLLRQRGTRVRPGRDDKVLVSWNGLMISSLAKGWMVTEDERYIQAATNAAEFVRGHMMKGDALLRTHRAGKSAIPGYLDDYAFLALGLLDLYEATFDLHWLTRARDLADGMIARFWDDDGGGFYFTGSEHRDLIARTKPTYDGAEPSGNAMAARLLWRLARYTDNRDYLDNVETLLGMLSPLGSAAPRAYMNALNIASDYMRPGKEIIVVGELAAPDTVDMLRCIRRHYLPGALVVHRCASAEEAAVDLPLLKGKVAIDGRATVYLCEAYACRAPVTDLASLEEQLS